jgi:hypothetical protein
LAALREVEAQDAVAVLAGLVADRARRKLALRTVVGRLRFAHER